MSAIMAERLAVCSWSLQPSTPQELADRVLAAGISNLQLALDPMRETPGIWGKTPEICRDRGISLVSGMVGCLGEDYSTLDSIRRTGGVAPDATWPQNLENLKSSALLARRLGLELVTFHAGFLPHDPALPEFEKMIQRLRSVAQVFLDAGLALGFETGQESAPDLVRVLKLLNCANVCVNFDPANMLLYDKGDPISALELLRPWLRQVHIKDAVKTQVPGQWGREVPAGEGEVDWPRFFATLKAAGFTGYCVIEREAGGQRIADIVKAKALVERFTA